MKFSQSAVLLLVTAFTSTYASPVANPIANSAEETTPDDECGQKYCVPYGSIHHDCQTSSGLNYVDQAKADPETYKKFTNCFCQGQTEELYRQCLTCYSDEDVKAIFITTHNESCGGGGPSDTPDNSKTDNTDDNTENTDDTSSSTPTTPDTTTAPSTSSVSTTTSPSTDNNNNGDTTSTGDEQNEDDTTPTGDKQNTGSSENKNNAVTLQSRQTIAAGMVVLLGIGIATL